MSCIGTITNNTNVKIKNGNYAILIEDIKNHNMKWQIERFEDLDNIQTIFDYFGIVIHYNDLEGYVEIDSTRGGFYIEDYTDEVLQIVAKYVESGSILEIDYKDYGEKERYVFKDKRAKKMAQKTIWEEV